MRSPQALRPLQTLAQPLSRFLCVQKFRFGLVLGHSSATTILQLHRPSISTVRSTGQRRTCFNILNELTTNDLSSTSLSSYYGGDTACATPHEKVSFEADRNLSPPEQSQFSQSVSSFDKQLDPRSYQVETLHQHDDVEFLPSWKRKLYRLSPIFTFLAVAAYFLYYAYRIHCTVIAQEAFNKTYVMAWLFIAAEGCVACE